MSNYMRQPAVTGPAGPAGATGATGASGPIASINGNATSAQVIAAGTEIPVSSIAGTTTITNKNARWLVPILTVSNNYSVSATDCVIIVDYPGGGSITIDLPTAVGIPGRMYSIKRIDNNSSYTVNVTPFGTETINDSSNITLFTYSVATIASDGANWFYVMGLN